MVFRAYINEMHGSRSKIPSRKISLGNVARRDLIPALKVDVCIPDDRFTNLTFETAGMFERSAFNERELRTLKVGAPL
jgi:hypothetical protein